MGKSLIIPGADFSVNAIEKEIEWYLDDSVFTNESSYEWGGYLVSHSAYTVSNIVDGISNKNINYVKVKKNPIADNAKLKIWHVSDFPSSTGTSVNVIETREIDIIKEGVAVYHFDTISLNNNETILISSLSSNIDMGRGAMQYVQSSGYTGYSFTINTLKWVSTAKYIFQINFGFK